MTSEGSSSAHRDAGSPGRLARRRSPILLLTLALLACGAPDGARDPAPSPGTVEDPPLPLAPAPWAAGATLPADAVPSPYLEAWRAAENREGCALLAFADPPRGDDPDARVRTARFGGGWGVAYDLPGLRSAFGVAGTGVEPGPDTYDDWPYRREWRDGSRAGWGPEGGSGPRQLAYLRVAGQRCLYNVWSRFGPGHVEALLEELRFVDPSIDAGP